jgi:hypothetical protein
MHGTFAAAYRNEALEVATIFKLTCQQTYCFHLCQTPRTSPKILDDTYDGEEIQSD